MNQHLRSFMASAMDVDTETANSFENRQKRKNSQDVEVIFI